MWPTVKFPAVRPSPLPPTVTYKCNVKYVHTRFFYTRLWGWMFFIIICWILVSGCYHIQNTTHRIRNVIPYMVKYYRRFLRSPHQRTISKLVIRLRVVQDKFTTNKFTTLFRNMHKHHKRSIHFKISKSFHSIMVFFFVSSSDNIVHWTWRFVMYN